MTETKLCINLMIIVIVNLEKTLKKLSRRFAEILHPLITQNNAQIVLDNKFFYLFVLKDTKDGFNYRIHTTPWTSKIVVL